MLFSYMQSDEMVPIKRIALILVLEESTKTIMYMHAHVCMYM